MSGTCTVLNGSGSPRKSLYPMGWRKHALYACALAPVTLARIAINSLAVVVRQAIKHPLHIADARAGMAGRGVPLRLLPALLCRLA